MNLRRFAFVLFVPIALYAGLAVRVQAQTVLINTIAGSGRYGYSGGSATSAGIDAVYAVACDTRGNVYLADSWNHRIRILSSDGMMTTLAGTGEPAFSGDGGPAIAAKLNCPRGIAVDDQGNVYISDSGNFRVRKVNSSGYISTIAGSGTAGFTGDGGMATSAQLNSPRGLALDAGGNLYVADAMNFRIRKITPQGIISTVAGMGAFGRSGDGGQATSATIGLVQSLALDRAGNLYFADAYNHCIRKVLPSGTILSLSSGGFGPGSSSGLAGSAQFRFPHGIAVDAQDRIFIADSENHRIRVIGPDGIITTFAGTGAAGFSGDGSAATAAQLNYPYALALDPAGGLIISDLRNYKVRKAHSTVQAPAFLRYFPLFANHTSRYTSLAVVNLAGSTAALTFRAYGETGAPLQTIRRTVASRSQLALLLNELMPSLSASSGWMEMEGDTPAVEGFFLMFDPSLSVMDGSAVAGTTLKEFVLPAIDGAEICLANPGSAATTCTLDYISGSGAVLKSEKVTLAGKGRTSIPASRLIPSGAAGGYLHGTSTTEVSVVECFGLGGWLGLISAIEGSSATGRATTMYAPQFAVGDGYASSLHAINLESSSLSLTLTLIGDDGQTKGRPYSLTLPAHGSAKVTGVEPFGLQVQGLVQGYVKMESTNGRFGGAVLFTDPAATKFGSALSFVGSGSNSAYFSQVAQNSQYWTGLAGINTNESEANVTVTVYDTVGQKIASGSRTVPPKGRFSKLLPEITGALPAMSRGYFEVSSTLPLACFALFGTNDGQVLAAIPSNAAGVSR